MSTNDRYDRAVGLRAGARTEEWDSSTRRARRADVTAFPPRLRPRFLKRGRFVSALALGVGLLPGAALAEGLDALCAYLAQDVEAARGLADDRPGFDAQGRPVAPADLPTGPGIGPHIFSFDVTPEAFALPSDLGVGNPVLVRIDVDLATGALYADGRPLEAADRDALHRRCAERGR